MVYSIGDEGARKQLLDGLVGVLQGECVRQAAHWLTARCLGKRFYSLSCPYAATLCSR